MTQSKQKKTPKKKALPKFEPTPEQHQLVTLLLEAGYTQEKARAHIINPATNKPLGREVFRRTFKEELDAAAQPAMVIDGQAIHFEPTAEQRKLVMLMAANGATQEQMRSNIINPRTGKPIWHEHFPLVFRDEIENALPQLNAMVAGNLYAIATSKTHKSAATAAIFWLKTRAGWREPESFHIEQRRMQFEAEAQRGEEKMVFTLRFEEEEQRKLEHVDDILGDA